ncbi:ABC transporter ATP-binding protein [Thermanaerothrix sp. 4228-RoL]|uniref:ABC transporter ATP-binding protein n=1 Tax=Thermanaerothrix solaris TaxID=3058434 RepID=A0ABU3NL63_9CHLR|nr:ABC transporter ATP-binding protein [Thermanaerothrix sp. 4228-RoL]MDT8896958.1 ABC transporter ATP-binding protein [Thermanaerothrix sp. 4228-RoL]
MTSGRQRHISIQVENLGKLYRIGQGAQASYQTLRDQISRFAAQPLRWLRFSKDSNGIRRNEEAFHIWALRGVSFEVRQGEVVGIIGRNGAGKSTLLKILTRITVPTEGRVDLWGRIGSLLEVGTGFHKELTGRENVYLNGAILGMKKAEIDQKFDEIVAFSEVERFIDTPVKYYSSGMAMRLAFAVAAHLDPEILLVDEVLAVGDAAFQKKCLDKMEEVGRAGRTILFVSHHMPSIVRLCERAIWLQDGQIYREGPAHQLVSEYLTEALGTTPSREWPDFYSAPGDEVVRLLAIRIRNNRGEVTDTFDIREPVGIEMEYVVLEGGYTLHAGFSLHNDEGQWLFASLDTDTEWDGKPRQPGRYRSLAWIPGNFLAEGTMIVGPSIRTEDPEILHLYEPDAVAFQVTERPGLGPSSRMGFVGHFPGIIRPYLQWETRLTDPNPWNGRSSFQTGPFR